MSAAVVAVMWPQPPSVAADGDAYEPDAAAVVPAASLSSCTGAGGVAAEDEEATQDDPISHKYSLHTFSRPSPQSTQLSFALFISQTHIHREITRTQPEKPLKLIFLTKKKQLTVFSGL